uniref:G-protein coupled receptors family 1 profile domain-containing protein n=1 Tax=Strigamia maritima TaxID=126957 RepID=T1JEB7_STRMM
MVTSMLARTVKNKVQVDHRRREKKTRSADPRGKQAAVHLAANTRRMMAALASPLLIRRPLDGLNATRVRLAWMDETDVEQVRYSLALTAIFCFAYALVFVMGMIGNGVVLLVIVRNPHMKTVTNCFIGNLAVADTLVILFCLPATLVGNIFEAWILGVFMCKSVSYLQGVSVSASINTLVAISIDRFLAICYPMRCQISGRMCRLIILIIWIWSLIISVPWAVYFQVEPYKTGDEYTLPICQEVWPKHADFGLVYYLVANLLLCYLLPLSLISICYLLIWRRVCRRQVPGETKGHGFGVDHIIHKSKIKAIKMLLAVVVLFALSWLPLYAIFTRIKCGEDLVSGSGEEALLQALTPFAQWLGASNSCINPVLYAFFNSKFRSGFKTLLSNSGLCCWVEGNHSSLRPGGTFRSSSTSKASSRASVIEHKITLLHFSPVTPI